MHFADITACPGKAVGPGWWEVREMLLVWGALKAPSQWVRSRAMWFPGRVNVK